MSTLRITELKDRVTDTLIPFYRARLTLDGRGNTSNIRDSVGITSVTFISEGNYRANFVSGVFPDGNYSVAGEALAQAGASGGPVTISYFNAAYTDSVAAYVESTADNFTFQITRIDGAGAGNQEPPLWAYLVFYY
jgi:hypothetical protein